MLHLRPLRPDVAESFYALAAEYLPDSDPAVMQARAPLYPDAFIAAMDGPQVVGVCFGWPRRLDQSDDATFTLAGIAVTSSRQRQGIGTRLLASLSLAASASGHATLSVGSAGGYVERFYIHNGFTPVQYKIWENGTPRLLHTFTSLADYETYARPVAEGFVVLEKNLLIP